jgi:hypothetical protein
MSTKSTKVPTMGTLLVGAAMTCLVAGSTTPAQAGIANASLGATATTAADLVGVPINASYRADYRYHRHHHHHHRHHHRHHHYYHYHYSYRYYLHHHHRHFWWRPDRIIIVVPF